MSNTVDNRVVEMKFDNQQFEQGVRQTIASLDSLKEALKFNTNATNLSTLQNAVNNFSLSNIESAVESLQYRFSAMGIAGATVIQDLTYKAIGLAEKLGSITLGQIMTGGKNRAQKVANARFQLEGLLESAEEVQSAFDSASKAVDGTAYGLDAAVSTASQLAASNVQLGEDLDTALRGVAGLAAMTNTDFEYMGNIFATVAGNGRLMGMQLSQISAHGVNAAAVLGKALGKTEEEIRDMTSKGQIDFQTFASAMNDAFGDQAQKANDTLQGSLNNVKAALSRIGEIFYSGIIENKDFIKFINNIRIAINGVKKSLEPLKKPFFTLVSAASKLGSAVLGLFNVNGLEDVVDRVARGMDILSGWLFKATAMVNEFKEATHLDEAVKKVEKANEVLRTLSEEQKSIVEDILFGANHYGNGQEREDALGDQYQDIQDYINAMYKANFDYAEADKIFSQMAVKNADNVTDATKKEAEAQEKLYSSVQPSILAISNLRLVMQGVKNQFTSFENTFKAIGKAFRRVFSYKDISKDVTSLLKVFKNLTEIFMITDERAEKIQRIFQGLFSVVDFLRQVFVSFVEVLSGTLAPVLSWILDLFLSLAAWIGDVVTEFNDFIKKNDTLRKIAAKTVEIFQKITSTISEFFSKFKELPAVQKLKDHFIDFTTKVGQDLLNFFSDAKDSVGEFFGSISEGDGSTMDRILGGINWSLEKFMELADKAHGKITNVFDWFNKKNKDAEEAGISISNISTNFEKLKKIGNRLANSTGPMDFLGNLIDGLSEFNGHVEGWVNSIINIFSGIDVAKLGLLGFAGSITALAASMSYFTFNMGTFARNVALFPKQMNATLSGIKDLLIGTKMYLQNESKAKVIKAYAIAIAVLAASLIALTFVDQEKLKSSTKCLAIIMGVMVLMVALITRLESASKDVVGFNKRLTSFAVMLLALSVSVLILTLALRELSEITWDKNAFKALGVLVAMFMGLVTLVFVFSSSTFINGFNLGAASLIICAASMWVLVKAIKGLTELNVDGIEEKLEVLIEVLLTIAIVARLASGMTFGSAVGVLAIVGSIWLIEMALKKIIKDGVSMTDIENNMNKFVPVLATLGVIAGVLYIVGKAGQQAKGAIGVILALTIAILGISYSLKKLAVLSMTGHLYNAVIALSAIFLGLIFLCQTIGSAEYEFTTAGKTLLKISAAVAILAAVVYFMGTKLSPEQAFQGLTIVGLLTLIIAALAIATQYAVNINGGAFYKMAGVIALLAALVALLSFIPNTEGLLTAVFALGAVLLAFGAAMYLATSHINEPAVLRLEKMILAVAIIAASLVGVLLVVKDMDFKMVVTAVASLTILMGMFGLLVKEIAVASSGVTDVNVFNSVVKIMLALVAAMVVIGASLTGVLYVAKSTNDILAAGLALAGLMAVLAICVKGLSGLYVDPSIGATLLVASLSLVAIAVALSYLAKGGFDFKAMAISVGAMAALLIVVVAALSALSIVVASGIGGAALGAALVAISVTLIILTTSLIGMGAACLILAIALNKLSQVNFKNIKDNLSTLIKLTMIMAGVAAVSIIFGAGLIVIGVGLALISVSISIIAASVVAVVTSINKLVKSFDSLLSTIERMAKDHKQISTGLNAITRTVVSFIINVISAIAKGIVNAAIVITKNAFIIANAVTTVLLAVITAISSVRIKIFTAIFNGIEQFLNLLIKRLPKIFIKISKVIQLIGDFLLNHIGYFGLLGAMLAAGFLMGTMDGLELYMGQLTDKAVELFTLFVASLADALVDNGDLMSNAVKSLINAVAYTLMNLLDSLTNGFFSRFDAYAGTMEELANEQDRLAEERARLKAEKGLKAEGEQVEAEADKLKSKYLKADKDISDSREENAEKAGWSIGEKTVTSANDAIDEYGRPYIKKVADLPSQAVEEMLKSGKYVKDETGEFLVSSFTVDDETKNSIVKSIAGMPSEAVDEMKKSGKWTLSEDGKYLVSTIAEAIKSDDSKQETEEAIEESQDNILDTLAGYKDKYLADGKEKFKYWKDGWLEGKTEYGDEITNSIHELTEDNIIDPTADDLGIDSPSKITRKFGGYWIEGFILGMESLKNSLEDSTVSVLNPVKDVMTTISDSLNTTDFDNIDLEPTIRPVIDMTNVNEASRNMGSMFDTSSTFKMAADSQVSINNSNQMQLANQVAALQQSVDKLANTDFSHMMDGVAINVNADTTVDGTVLRKTASNYTIGQINRKEQGYMMATGGRF